MRARALATDEYEECTSCTVSVDFQKLPDSSRMHYAYYGVHSCLCYNYDLRSCKRCTMYATAPGMGAIIIPSKSSKFKRSKLERKSIILKTPLGVCMHKHISFETYVVCNELLACYKKACIASRSSSVSKPPLLFSSSQLHT